MIYHPVPGLIEVICGSMFSGKTEELLRRLKRAQIARQKIQIFKPVIDNRYSADHVQSHDANRLPSQVIQHSHEILPLALDHTRIFGIDEVQFFDDGIVEVAQKLAYRGARVIVAGLDLDFRGQPFGPMPRLLCIAEQVTKLTAVCVVCGAPATRTQRLHSSAAAPLPISQIAVGSKDLYEPRCRFCHEPEPTAHSLEPEVTPPPLPRGLSTPWTSFPEAQPKHETR